MKYADVTATLAFAASAFSVAKQYRNDTTARPRRVSEVTKEVNGETRAHLQIKLRNRATVKAVCESLHLVPRGNRFQGLLKRKHLVKNSIWLEPSENAIGMQPLEPTMGIDDEPIAKPGFIIPERDTFIDTLVRDDIVSVLRKSFDEGPVYLRVVVIMTNGKRRRSWRTLRIDFQPAAPARSGFQTPAVDAG